MQKIAEHRSPDHSVLGLFYFTLFYLFLVFLLLFYYILFYLQS